MLTINCHKITGIWAGVRFMVSDQSGETNYLNCTLGRTYEEASELIADCAQNENARHPADWPTNVDPDGCISAPIGMTPEDLADWQVNCRLNFTVCSDVDPYAGQLFQFEYSGR